MMTTSIGLASGDDFETVLDLDVVGAAVLVPPLHFLRHLDAGVVSSHEFFYLTFAAINKNKMLNACV